MVRHFVPSVEELVWLGEESNTEFKQLGVELELILKKKKKKKKGVELELNMSDLKLNPQFAMFNQKKVNTYKCAWNLWV